MLYDSAATLRAHSVRTLKDRVVYLRKLVWWGDGAFRRGGPPTGGLRDAMMRQIGLAVTESCRARDDMCELSSIFEFVKRNVRYTGDISDKDTFQSAYRTLQYGGGDCLPLDTIVCKAVAGTVTPTFVPLYTIMEGDRIMANGAGNWTRVLKCWFTGLKQILVFELSNGTALRCSPEHRLLFLNGGEIRAARIEVGDQLLTPRNEIPLEHGTIPVSLEGVRVVAIKADKHAKLCMDITTDAGMFWLPESDVLVHNCDDHSVLNAVLAMENGFSTRFRITSNTGATWDHIFCMAGVPKGSPRKWVALDTTLPGSNKFGVQPPMVKYQDFDVTEAK